jgi:transcriptional regulator GlxA family with amidase domain
MTRPFLVAENIDVLPQTFYSHGNIATAGGCLAAPYLVAWVIARKLGSEAAVAALRYVAPVGEEQEWIANAMKIACGENS